jgi:iron complex outermembrane recepter protein
MSGFVQRGVIMLKNRSFWGASWAVLALTGGLIVSPAFAQEASNPGGTEGEVDDTIVVTGSLIRGAVETDSVPIEVITAEELVNSGSPTVVELLRNLSASSGADGETNQFTSNGLEGLSNVNLRGLGPSRTLVLLNGRRMATAPYGIGETAQPFVDTNLIPTAAIGRVEVLKEGAAATYGSDAIAGVVNFITRRNFNGLEVGGDYQFIEGSDGNYTVSGAAGWANDATSLLFSAGYQRRSELSTRERDWAVRPYEENPEGGWSSISNPGRFFRLPAFSSFVDPNCGLLGGRQEAAACRFQFSPFDNLIEEEERYQLFAEWNQELGDGHTFHLEGLYARTDVPEWKTSPSYPPQALLGQIVPATHPGAIDFFAQNPTLGAIPPAGLVYFGRTFGWGGLPPNGTAQTGFRNYAAFRVSAGLKGSLFGDAINYDIGATYMEDRGQRGTPDTYVERLRLALLGLGGPACTGSTPGANGCLYYNPFSNAIARGAINGVVNPQYRAALANSPELVDWMTDLSTTDARTNLMVVDAVFTGNTPITLGGGPVAWAAGAQYRVDGYKLDPNDIADLTVFPCTVPGVTNCASPTGPLAFLAGTLPADLSRDVKAVFAEMNVPFSDTFEAQLALRYEDYGGAVGSTIDPKLSVRWQVMDWLALRASGGTTFRGPALTQLNGQFTSLQFIAPANAFRAVDTFGNPNLSPESATTYNFGIIVEPGNFRGTIDYWGFDFSDPVIIEPVDAIISNVLANITTSPLLSRVTFNGTPSGANVSRVAVNIINGPDIKTSGVDISGEYTFDNVFWNSEFTIGASASYIIEYVIDDLRINGLLVAPSFDAVGKLNRGTGFRSQPQWKGELFANWEVGNHNVRLISRYTTDYTDQRTTPYIPRAELGGVAVTAGKTIEAVWMHDLNWTWRMENGLRLSASVSNILDEDPPFARLDLNYDPYTHNPIGRTIKIGFSRTFDGWGF